MANKDDFLQDLGTFPDITIDFTGLEELGNMDFSFLDEMTDGTFKELEHLQEDILKWQ